MYGLEIGILALVERNWCDCSLVFVSDGTEDTSLWFDGHAKKC